ncbi:hypothetical protein [Desulfuromonas sp. AOP6]|uniref:hypothetical protein n=1 Tax=Desulfuromonas sp. AOP6 TaxID=1566351 RepID=UPI0012DE2D2B|nr:hypothetical protein [Desulfuromonas sp. AOP6]
MIDYSSFFKEWKCWDKFEDRIDGINGVYAFRLKNKFGRLIGESEILYFGKCDQNPKRNRRPGLWHRLKNYRQSNAGASKRLQDLENTVGGRCEIEYAYVVCQNPRETEQMLLQDYFSKHFEYPPLNRNS